MHSVGGYGSTGYQYDWTREEAMKNVLRTHTTAVSARMLCKLAEVMYLHFYGAYDFRETNQEKDASHLGDCSSG